MWPFNIIRWERSMATAKTSRRLVRVGAFCIVWLLVVWTHQSELSCSANDAKSSNKNTTSYEWEDWDYYTILGLDPHVMQTYDTKSIQKAYRKQAQMWHPDKLIHHQQQQENTTSASSFSRDKKQSQKKTTAIPSIEECTARFARIAEAYQVLTDDEQRQEYNEYLAFELKHRNRSSRHRATTTREESRSDDYKPSWSFPWEAFQNLDPLRMFEEFFGFDKESENDDDPYFRFHSAFDESQGQQYTQHAKPPPSWFMAPDRVREERLVRVDPYSGRETLRILQYEEYYDYNDNSDYDNAGTSVYTRVLAQDFVDKWNPYERAWVYQPLQSEPIIVEQGYKSSFAGGEAEDSLYADRRLDPSMLWPGTMLVSGSTMRNKWGYVVQLSSTCELHIIHRLGDALSEEREDGLVWSSDTELAPSSFVDDNDCRLQLRGSHLVLTAGNPEKLLWYSPALHSDNEPMFVSRLDADGSLAVYRLETVAFATPWLASLWDNTMLLPDNMKPGIMRLLFPVRLRRMLWSVLLFGGKPLWHLSPTNVVHGVCESATGSPFGCFRLGRKLVQVYRFGRHLIQMLLAILDHFFDQL